MGKIISQKKALSIRKACRRKAQTVVFTNGCFDIIHRGHLEYLVKAKKLGDVLMIGLNSDKSVRLLKGKGRPIISQKDRAAILSHLDMVDYVTIFGALTPRALIARLEPDILVKGGDYEVGEIVGAKEVERAGGKIITIPLIAGKSTSEIISSIKDIKL